MLQVDDFRRLLSDGHITVPQEESTVWLAVKFVENVGYL
jgi:hypothetical protein